MLQSNAEFDIEYTYLVDEAFIQNGSIIRGSFVVVPFGYRKQLQTAVVWRIGDNYEANQEEKVPYKTIAGTSSVRPPLEAYEIALAEQMQKLYFCSISSCVKCMIPPAAPKGRLVKFAKLTVSPAEADAAAASGILKNIKQIRVLEQLKDGECPIAELAKAANCSPCVLETLAKKGFVQIYKQNAKPENAASDIPQPSVSLPTYGRHVLNEEQQKAYDFIRSLIRQNRFSECLIHGVTGSGKTELYMQLISDTIENGGAALLLVPEISLTPQMTAHFNNRFGGKVAILHSRLSDAERNRQWNLIQTGKVSVAIGARSAIFAPFRNLRLIILDEEHETSYKSEDMEPRYHAVEVAEAIGRIRNLTVLYGSATPRIETFYRAVRHEIYYVPLTKRANQADFPKVLLEDMREARENGEIGRNGIFGKQLIQALQENYGNGKQAMLFVHRRGYARQMVCKSCGSIMKCGKCSIPMTYHEKGGRLICHYCGRTVPAPENCPVCGSTEFDKYGTGTQKIVETLQELFPGELILRMDTDTTAGKDGHAKILTRFSAGEAKFLVGTQMIAKGHDFPNVTLVGIIAADGLINMPDYRAEERAFELLTQMAGRAGRGNFVGKVIIQAYHIDDYAITAASHHDYQEFYKNEITVRKNLRYPPFCALCVLRFSGEDDQEVYRTAYAAAKRMEQLQDAAIEQFGPARAELPKLNGKYRWLITLKGERRECIIAFLDRLTDHGKIIKKIKGRTNLAICFDGR